MSRDIGTVAQRRILSYHKELQDAPVRNVIVETEVLYAKARADVAYRE
jgi:hypothetical protein